MKSFGILVQFLLFVSVLSAQPTVGTTGLLNIPTAEIQKDGTFIVGGNYLPDPIITDKLFKYTTGNYYFNLTFLPFWEVSYKLTFLKVRQNKFNQDRSVAVRGRLFKERKIRPALTIGMDDIYSSSENGNHFFKSNYWVATKNLKFAPFSISTTIGQRVETSNYQWSEGFFGGLSLSLKKLEGLKLMAEYDSNVFNAGASVFLFKHLKIQVFAYDMKYLTGGIQYLVYLK